VNARVKNTARPTTIRVSRQQAEPSRVIPLSLDTAWVSKGGISPNPIANQSMPRALAAGKLKHNFVIQLLKKSGFFQPQPYVYFCIRCRFTFLVNQTRGSVVAVNSGGKPLSDQEIRRVPQPFFKAPVPLWNPRIEDCLADRCDMDHLGLSSEL
jgi:hypothetical protein